MKNKIVLIVVVAVLIIFGIWFLMSNDNNVIYSTPESLYTEQKTVESVNNAEEAICENGNDAESLPAMEYIPEDVAIQVTSDFEDEVSEADSEYEEESLPIGTIIGEIYFNSIALSRLFAEPISEVLPPPRGYRDHFFFFEGFQVTAMSGLDGEASIVNIWPPYLNNLTVNEVMLENDMTRMDLYALFGAPLENYECFQYRISNPVGDIVLIFRFEYPDAEATIQSIAIW